MDWKQLLASITHSVDEELRLRNAYLVTENRILRQQIMGRVPLSNGDRLALAEIGQKLGRKALAEIATIAKPDTILAWHCKLVAQPCDGTQPRTSLGRPRIDKELENLVVRMARENRSWGYDRIVGALLNLALSHQRPDRGEYLETPWDSPSPGAEEDHHLAGVSPYSQRCPHGHRLLQQRGVGLVGARAILPPHVALLCSCSGVCRGHDAVSPGAADAPRPETGSRWAYLWAELGAGGQAVCATTDDPMWRRRPEDHGCCVAMP